MGKCVEMIRHDACGSSRLQVFQDENGDYNGYCFSCGTPVSNPYKDQPEGYVPSVKIKTEEQIQEELDTITNEYPCVDLPARKLSATSLDHFGIKIGLSESDGSTPESYHFPYYDDNENIVAYKNALVQKDERGKKRMWSTGDIKKGVFFGWHQAIKTGAKRVLITEGECFLPNAQVLTPQGWVSLEDYGGQDVAQYEADGSLRYVSPFAIIDKHYEGNLVEYRSGSYYSITTENHKMVRMKGGVPFKCEATRYKYLPVPRVGALSHVSSLPQDLARAWVMLSADFAFSETGEIIGSFKKKRKIARAKEILDNLGVRYTQSVQPSSPDKVAFYIHKGHGLPCKKLFDWELIGTDAAQTILDELVHWGGNTIPNRDQFEYASKELHNAEFVQALAHTHGYVSTIINRKNKLGSWYKVSVLRDKTTSSTQNGYKKIPYSGRVMCLQVPSGMLLVRQNNSISVSGNCDAVALWAMIQRTQKGTQWEGTGPAVISIKNGASSAARDISAKLPDLRKHFSEIVLVFDTDDAGKRAVEEVLKIAPDIMSVTLPCKDANECLIKGHIKAAVNACLFRAEKPKNSRLVQSSTLLEAASTPPIMGLSTPYTGLTKLIRGMRTGETWYFGAGTKMGKSSLVNEFIRHFILEHGWKVFAAKPEESNIKTIQLVAGVIANKIFHDPEVAFDKGAFDAAASQIGDNLMLLNCYQHLGWDTLRADIRAAATEGAKLVIIDPITNLTVGMNSAEANTQLVEIATELATISMDLDILTLIFCHLKAPDSGPSHERGGEVLSTQFAGSRAMMRACHGMVGMEGNKDPDLPERERNRRTLVLLEDRNFGQVGRIQLQYDTQTGRLVERFS